MSPAAALQFPAPDTAGAEWGGEEAEALDAAASHRAHRLEMLRDGLRIGQPDGSPTDLTTLRSQVATIVAGNHSAGPAWPTGIPELDSALGGGVPRGRVTEVVGSLGAGKTSLVRQLVQRVLSAGGWVAWIDATRTLAPQELAGLGERLVVVRPRDYTRGAWCADLLLRSGVFSLVVLDGAPVLSRVVGVRLSQLAREQDAAFVVLREGTQGSRLGGAVRLQMRAQTRAPATPPTHMPAHMPMRSQAPVLALSERVQSAKPAGMERSYSVLVEKGGSYRTVEVNCAIVMARRVCTDSEIPDRRGVARRTRVAAEDNIGRPEQGDERGEEHSPRQPHDGGRATVAAIGRHTNSGHESTTVQSSTREYTHQGRGRPRAAESGYGRSSRRGEACKLLRAREYEQRATALGRVAEGIG